MQHQTYFEKLKAVQASNDVMSRELEILHGKLKQKADIDGSDGRSRLIDHLLCLWRDDRMKNVFRAWTHLCRSRRIRFEQNNSVYLYFLWLVIFYSNYYYFCIKCIEIEVVSFDSEERICSVA